MKKLQALEERLEELDIRKQFCNNAIQLVEVDREIVDIKLKISYILDSKWLTNAT